MSQEPLAPDVEIDGARVEQFVWLAGLVPSGKVTLLTEGREIERPSGVAICRYVGEDSVYLFYCTDTWKVLAAGHHSSLQAAEASAECAYPGLSERWVHRA